jgi:hypothetical protein
MTVTPIVINLAGSLVAVLALAWLARWMGLGEDVRIRDADHARALAQDVLYGFDPVDTIVDKAGFGAILRDSAGQQMLIRRNGARFAGRMLEPGMDARLDRQFLTLGSANSTFGAATLNLGEDAQTWAAGLRNLPIRTLPSG